MASKDLAELLLLAWKVSRRVSTGMLTDQMGSAQESAGQQPGYTMRGQLMSAATTSYRERAK